MTFIIQGLVRECSDYDLAKQINRVTGFLMKESPNEHLLRAQSTIMLTGVNTIVEPAQAGKFILFHFTQCILFISAHYFLVI